ncbi:formyltetrahydrofolate deformylase [Leucobacter celer]|uniref:formyltetrahydrofolate deformylase n=1 Tax=Leucobacter celer TaxID=668625 RepID=UPI000AB41071|nr:formyltetrahydrofolate deformylase [Leucobacter celer]
MSATTGAGIGAAAAQVPHVLTLRCTDEPGIVAAVSQTVFAHGANITDSAQYAHERSGTFTLRMEIDVPADGEARFDADLRSELARFDPVLSLRRRDRLRRVVIMVSKADHCLWDLLYHWRSGDLPVEIVAVVGNHDALRPLVEPHGIPFHLLPITAETKARQEERLHDIVSETGADFIVLARYMQILSDDFCARYPGRIINIHHSFLPGFKGAKPYHQAYDRGVKLIGATAHYVTGDLDEGPIIEQNVVRVSHRQLEDDLVRTGRDVERRVLTRAVRLHAEDRVMLTGHRTVVFD